MKYLLALHAALVGFTLASPTSYTLPSEETDNNINVPRAPQGANSDLCGNYKGPNAQKACFLARKPCTFDMKNEAKKSPDKFPTRTEKNAFIDECVRSAKYPTGSK
ncbi:hypothetical protein G6O67_007901 [Ophiocordyceps sinensis]|uniref:Uncharacterized protein n=2 Tax=Ophiocordyceps sinensis TaxID=72228 RepID=A0A8H4LSP7_9HYPO|nr:hypothetical protein OCS_04631 [Ophiocordyceps sinensis CO18]KAF4504451.1 hypothetical protein G6O67_007901 [Ophiocordyceps sinensis]